MSVHRNTMHSKTQRVLSTTSCVVTVIHNYSCLEKDANDRLQQKEITGRGNFKTDSQLDVFDPVSSVGPWAMLEGCWCPL